LIQSFAVGETTPEEAHKIGMELAGAVLGGKYEFVLTTHVDKDHLHNHLICAPIRGRVNPLSKRQA
jgi:type IV secretory pathway VirD2 relaxase